MTWMLKVKVRWAGFNGAPGWSNFYFRDFTDGTPPTQAQADGAATRVSDFFGSIKQIFPASITTQVQSDVEVVEDSTGKMEDVFTTTVRAAVPGTNTGTNFSAPTGMVVTWRSAGVVNGRRVRGRTFLVPIAAIGYQSDGTIEASTVTAVQTAANALVASTGTPDLGIFVRPIKDANGNVLTPGQWVAASSATVPDMAAILKSRRN